MPSGVAIWFSQLSWLCVVPMVPSVVKAEALASVSKSSREREALIDVRQAPATGPASCAEITSVRSSARVSTPGPSS